MARFAGSQQAAAATVMISAQDAAYVAASLAPTPYSRAARVRVSHERAEGAGGQAQDNWGQRLSNEQPSDIAALRAQSQAKILDPFRRQCNTGQEDWILVFVPE